MGDDVTTWHHGLMARWWANFNLDGPEIDFFRPYVEAGRPALDVGCGTGRLLAPWVAAGLDVDGADASADMIEACRAAVRAAAPAGGHQPGLYVQPTHRLDLPRRYGAAIACGSFGLGVTRAQDLEGLRRVRDHLRPGGLLALDYECDEIDAERWRRFRPTPADPTPPPAEERRLGADGHHYALRRRTLVLDADARSMTLEIQLWQWTGDDVTAHETHPILINVYDRDEIVAALGAAGFVDVRVVGGYHGGEPIGDERFLVYLATAP